MSKNLTSKSYEKLLSAFSHEEARAVDLYTKLRASLVRFFQIKGIGEADEAADETLDRVAEKLSQAVEINDLKSFAFGIARFVALEKYRREGNRARLDGEYQAQRAASENFAESEEITDFRECLDKLPAAEKHLILEYFEDLSHPELIRQRSLIAERENLTLNSLRIKVSRLRRRLAECLQNKIRKKEKFFESSGAKNDTYN